MENTDHLQDPYEAEEALSLCDLPIYSDVDANWDDYSKEEQRLSSDNDFFEFFSEDFSTASTCSDTASKNIIFCGKLIPYRELPDPEKAHDTRQTETKKGGFLRWKSLSFNKKKGSSSNCDFSVGKVSVLAPATKSRWYLFLFGMAGLPTEMELRDIKIRQSRLRSQSSMTVECDEMVKGGNARRRGNGLWRLLSVLGCRGHQTNAVVKG